MRQEKTMPDTGVRTVTIEDRAAGKIEITGQVIGFVSTRHGAPGQNLQRRRWGVNQVIKTRSGKPPYVLVREAFSVIYHRDPTTCETRNGAMAGESAALDDLPDDAFPCRVCRPPWPEDLDERDRVRFEFPRRTIDQCEDPAAVTERLTTSRKFSGTVVTGTPEPFRDLLEQCARNDPDWLDAAVPVLRIG